MIGKAIRLERILDRNTHRTVIVPMDHGVTLGPIPGLADMRKSINEVVEGGTNAIIIHKGIVGAGHRGGGKDVGLILHLSGSTVLSPDPNAKIPVCTVEEAIRLGADAVSIHVNLGADTDTAMLAHLADVSRRCSDWGMPLVAMMYPRGEKIVNQYDVRLVKHAARVAAELGADVVKVNYTGSAETFTEVCAGCPIPVVIAGGEKMDTDEQVLRMIAGALAGGAAGVSIGRNAFQHRHPRLMVQAIARMVHGGRTVEDSLAFLERGAR
jgi:predicted phospho-2-dehydro-3-deoxyheptonate aldolase